MSQPPFAKDYARQARLFRASRDRWKQRCAAKQDEIRYLRVRLRDLEASRQRWKHEALQRRVPQTLAAPAAAEHDLGGAPARRRS
jgi:hypothetical protein